MILEEGRVLKDALATPFTANARLVILAHQQRRHGTLRATGKYPCTLAAGWKRHSPRQLSLTGAVFKEHSETADCHNHFLQ